MKKIYVIVSLILLGNCAFSQNKLVLHDSIFNGGHMYNAVSADFDKDGDMDFIAHDWNGVFRMFTNDGNAHFTPINLNDFLYNSVVVLGDIDGDTITDVILAANSPHTMEVWLGNGDTTFTKSTDHGITSGPGGIRTLQLFDADNDGDLDLLKCNGQAFTDVNSYSELWLNDSTGKFTLKQQFTKEGFQVSAAIGDIDGDNDPDLVFGQAGQPATIFFNDGTGTFTYSYSINPYSGDYRFLDDVDEDGDLDLLLTDSYNNFGLRICFNDGNGIFSSDPKLAFGSEGTFKGQKMIDMDGDGYLDFITGGDADNLSLYYRYTGCTFEKSDNLLSRGYNGVEVSDFNGDLKPDLLFMNRDGYSKIFLNYLTPGDPINIQTIIDKTDHSYNVCKGSDLTLYATSNTSNLLWAGPDSFSSTDQNPVLSGVTKLQEGYYTLTADYYACTISDSTMVNVVQVDSTVIVVDNTLTANAIDAQYQWFDCSNASSPINLATEKQYVPDTSGSYSVEVTDTNGCVATSSCSEIVISPNNPVNSINFEFNKGNSKLYPNPSSAIQTLAFSKCYPEVRIKITDVNGKIIDTKRFQNVSEIELNVENYQAMYFIEIITLDGLNNLVGLKAN